MKQVHQPETPNQKILRRQDLGLILKKIIPKRMYRITLISLRYFQDYKD